MNGYRWYEGQSKQGRRTLGILPPGNVNELLDVADFLGLLEAQSALNSDGLGGERAYHGGQMVLLGGGACTVDFVAS